MIDQLVRQLQDPDPERRRQAIMALGKNRSPAALPHLAKIYREDPEPSLRELARRAGMHIRQGMEGGGAKAPASQAPPQPTNSVFIDEDDEPPLDTVMVHSEDDDEPDLDALIGSKAKSKPTPLSRKLQKETPAPAPKPEPEPVPVATPAPSAPVRGQNYEVSREQVKRSKELLESALSLNMRSDNAGAMKVLAGALEVNPNLVNDGYFMSVAGSVTGLEGDGAVQMILDSNQRKGFVKLAQEKKKQERIDKHLTEAKSVTWTSTMFELVLFAIITGVGPVLERLVAGETARNFLINMTPGMPRSMIQSITSLTVYDAGSLITTGLISSISGVVGLLLQAVIIHFIATKMLRGNGTLRFLLETLLSFYNKWLPIIFFVSFIAVAFAFISEFSPMALCVVLPLVLLTLYVAGKTSGKIGEAYDFSAGMGCFAYVVSSIIIALLSVGITLLIGPDLSAFIP